MSRKALTSTICLRRYKKMARPREVRRRADVLASERPVEVLFGPPFHSRPVFVAWSKHDICQSPNWPKFLGQHWIPPVRSFYSGNKRGSNETVRMVMFPNNLGPHPMKRIIDDDNPIGPHFESTSLLDNSFSLVGST